jgi:hypothetical protein
MSRSYSKIRHIQNTNLILESRFLVEQVESKVPTNSLQTLQSLSTTGKRFFSSFNEDEDKVGYFKDQNNKKNILNFSDLTSVGVDKFETINHISIFDESQFNDNFTPKEEVKIKPGSKFITYGEDINETFCNIIYIDSSSGQVSVNKLGIKQSMVGK